MSTPPGYWARVVTRHTVTEHHCARSGRRGTVCQMGAHDKPIPDPDPTGDAQPPPGRPLPPPPDPGKHGKPDPPDKGDKK